MIQQSEQGEGQDTNAGFPQAEGGAPEGGTRRSR